MVVSEQQMLGFFRAWPWIVSDRVAEFDDALHRPIRSVPAVQSCTRDLVGKWEMIEPEEPVDVVLGYFREMLASLQAAGEDIGRIYDWARSLSLFMQDSDAQHAMVIWRETFERFARGKRTPAQHIDEDTLEVLCESFLRDAYKPGLDFATRVQLSTRQWLSGRGRRTDFDDIMWNHFFYEREIDPGWIVSLGYGQVLVREWWRIARESLSEDQFAQLRVEQIENTKTFAKSRIPVWKLDLSVNEKMVVEGFPVFDTLRP